ncbi:MAG: hypothetical protein IPP17_04555 [Bacteroidetes bacterium]|nr:hypothetical protein [Bacteroidota bacterium]
MGRSITFLFLLTWLPGLLLAQDERSMMRLSFDRQNDFTFSTMLDARYAFQKGRYSLDFKLNHSNIYNSSRDEGRFVQMYFHTDLWQYFQLKKRLDVASWIETDQYVNNQNEKISVYGGIRYKPWSFLHVTPLVGYTWDTRTAILGRTEPTVQLDQGISPALFVTSSHEWKDQLTMRTQLIARYKQISPRRQYNVVVDHEWTKRFEEGVTLSAGVHASTHELDDYQGNSVKRIQSDTLMPHFELRYEFAPGLEWQSSNNMLLHRRRFVFQNLVFPTPEENNLTFQGVELGTMQRLSWVTSALRASGSYEFQYSSRGYLLQNNLGMNESDFEAQVEREKQKDFTKNFQKVEFDVLLPLRRHSLELKTTNQYLQYDTPSETNFDDRDELSWVAAGKWKTGWNKTFQTAFQLQGNYRHYAFLLKEKSQDNYIQRSLRMDFDFAWDLHKTLRLEGQQSIYVTYNVKDFVDYNKTDRSTRNLETNLKGMWRPSRRLQVEANFRRKETHQSYLNWEKFTETTLDTNRILTIDNKYRYTFDGKSRKTSWYAEAGYKHFDQTKRFRTNMVGFDNLLKAISLRQVSLQTGPLLNIGYRHKNQSTIDIGCWLQVQVHKNKYEVLANNQIFGTAQQELDLQQVTVEFRPYPTARINYFFGGGR